MTLRAAANAKVAADTQAARDEVALAQAASEADLMSPAPESPARSKAAQDRAERRKKRRAGQAGTPVAAEAGAEADDLALVMNVLGEMADKGDDTNQDGSLDAILGSLSPRHT